MERRLAAILAADAVGYSRLMGQDEAGTLKAVNSHRSGIFEPKSRQYHGRTVKVMGDGILMEFPSAVDAVAFAVEVQCAIRKRNTEVPEDRRIDYRIGINIGDIIIENADIFGDGVNIAARLEAMAEPGGICVASNVFDQVRGKLDLNFASVGNRKLKNIVEPVAVFAVNLDEKADALVTGLQNYQGRKPVRTVIWAGLLAFLLLVAIAAAVVSWPGANSGPSPPEPVAVEMSDKPIIAVMPFANMSHDAQQDYFSDGITDDVITDLSRVSGLFVIARNTMFAYKANPVAAQKIATELGAGYALEGSVQKSGNRVRINVQLVEARSGHSVWAERYDRELSDVFALQDEVVAKIVSALSVKLQPTERDQLTRSAKAHPEAYDTLLLGLAKYRQRTPESIAESRHYFERAIEFDPGFARAYADLALSYANPVDMGFVDDRQVPLQTALGYAEQALKLDDMSPHVYFALSIVYRVMKLHDKAIAAARRALEIDPNYADGYGTLAVSLNYVGKPAEALVEIEKAQQLNPQDSVFYVWIKGQSYYLLDRISEAIALFEQSRSVNPEFVLSLKMLAASYAAVGRIDDAEWAAAELLTLVPDFSVSRESENISYLDADTSKQYIERLRMAGIPE